MIIDPRAFGGIRLANAVVACRGRRCRIGHFEANAVIRFEDIASRRLPGIIVANLDAQPILCALDVIFVTYQLDAFGILANLRFAIDIGAWRAIAKLRAIRVTCKENDIPLAIVLANGFAGPTGERAAFGASVSLGTLLVFGVAALEHGPRVVQTNLDGVVIAARAIVETLPWSTGMCNLTAQKAINRFFGCGQFTAIGIRFDVILTRNEARSFAGIDAIFADFGFANAPAGRTNHVGCCAIGHLPIILDALHQDIAIAPHGAFVAHMGDALSFETIAGGVRGAHF